MVICPHDRVTHFSGYSGVQNWLFYLKYEWSFCIHVTVLATSWSYMLPTALSIILMYIRRVRNIFQVSMGVFPYASATHFLGWYHVQKWLFCLKDEWLFGRKDTVFGHEGIRSPIRGFFTLFLYTCGRLGISQAAMNVCPYHTSSHVLGCSGAQNQLFCL